MKKILLPIILILVVATATSQTVSCNELYNYVLDNASYPQSVSCFGSSVIVKAVRYDIDGTGFVVAHLKQGEYDFTGKPYIFCGISSYAWSSFTAEGIYDSWGKAFHNYIMDKTCNCN